MNQCYFLTEELCIKSSKTVTNNQNVRIQVKQNTFYKQGDSSPSKKEANIWKWYNRNYNNRRQETLQEFNKLKLPKPLQTNIGNCQRHLEDNPVEPNENPEQDESLDVFAVGPVVIPQLIK